MIRLETVEDFEKVRKALGSPKAKPHEYRVRSFGYCSICNDVTEYEGDYSLEGCYETCFKCTRTFGQPSPGRPCTPEHWYLTEDKPNIPREVADKIKQLHSKKQQQIFFQEALSRFLQKQKSKQRQSRNAVRRLAKLR